MVVGEEATAKNSSLLDAISTADLAVVLDPLDGTKNFVSGLPLFGMMIAATVRGELVLAAIHDPVYCNMPSPSEARVGGCKARTVPAPISCADFRH